MGKNHTNPSPPPYIKDLSGNQQPHIKATCDMIILALFLLLRSGKYTGTKYDYTPFCLCDAVLPCDKLLI